MRAEIAGGGIAGLTLATALATKGWVVRVHERNEHLREIGAGIFLWENALKSLEYIGAIEPILKLGHKVTRLEVWDDGSSLIQERDFEIGDAVRLYTARRQDLYAALLDAARKAGVEIQTGSFVTGAHPRGALILANGSEVEADMVVGADGVNSRVCDSLGLRRRDRTLPGGTVRVLVPRLDFEQRDSEWYTVVERWNGVRRFLYVPVANDEVYLALGTVEKDKQGSSIPVNKATWQDAFPSMAGVIDRISVPGRWDQFRDIRVSRWFKGRAAIVGDAAHAQPPHLAQGAALSMSNAIVLAELLSRTNDVDHALAEWESVQRPLTVHTQKWTRLYGFVVASIPARATRVRSRILRFLKNWAYLQRNLSRAASQHPLSSIDS